MEGLCDHAFHSGTPQHGFLPCMDIDLECEKCPLRWDEGIHALSEELRTAASGAVRAVLSVYVRELMLFAGLNEVNEANQRFENQSGEKSVLLYPMRATCPNCAVVPALPPECCSLIGAGSCALQPALSPLEYLF